jgi:uncharacterized membrane protein
MSFPNPLSDDHIEDTIRAITQLHAEHRENSSTFQRGVEHTTGVLGNPITIVVVLLVVLGWIAASMLGYDLGYRPFDPPPFSGLLTVISVASFFMVMIIFATQRNEDQLAFHREQLILELVISCEQKTTKVIQLLEEYRRDNPMIGDRVDHQANEMARPADPSSVLGTIRHLNAGGKSAAESRAIKDPDRRV